MKATDRCARAPCGARAEMAPLQGRNLLAREGAGAGCGLAHEGRVPRRAGSQPKERAAPRLQTRRENLPRRGSGRAASPSCVVLFSPRPSQVVRIAFSHYIAGSAVEAAGFQGEPREGTAGETGCEPDKSRRKREWRADRASEGPCFLRWKTALQTLDQQRGQLRDVACAERQDEIAGCGAVKDGGHGLLSGSGIANAGLPDALDQSG